MCTDLIMLTTHAGTQAVALITVIYGEKHENIYILTKSKGKLTTLLMLNKAVEHSNQEKYQCHEVSK